MTTYRGFCLHSCNFQFCRCRDFGAKGQNIFARTHNTGSIELEAETDIWPFGAFCTTGCAIYTTEMTAPGYWGKIELLPYTGGWVTNEHRCKTPQQNFSKQNSTQIKKFIHHDQLGLIQGCKDSSIHANQSMWYSILTNWKIKAIWLSQ